MMSVTTSLMVTNSSAQYKSLGLNVSSIFKLYALQASTIVSGRSDCCSRNALRTSLPSATSAGPRGYALNRSNSFVKRPHSLPSNCCSLHSSCVLPATPTTATESLSFSSTPQENNRLKFDLFQLLASLGHKDEKVCKGMVDALEAIHGVGKISESIILNFGTPALERLAESVEKELARPKSTFTGMVHFVVTHHGFSFDLPCNEGESLMTLAKSPLGQELLSEYLECACGGNMSCATCHVILDQDTFDKLDPPTAAELDMLDLAFEPSETSRLGCQIKMTPDLDGMKVKIPSDVNNFWS